MKDIKKTLIILALTTFFACNESNEMKDQYYNLDVGMEFSIFNPENEDLLNPGNSNHLDISKIKLFYIINGKKQEVYDANLTNPRNFMIYKHKNEYRIGITPNYTETSNKPITYIQWNDSDIDTIEVSYERTQKAILHNNIWLNGEKIWERGKNGFGPYFVLTK